MYLGLKEVSKMAGVMLAGAGIVGTVYLSQPVAPTLYSTTFAFNPSPSPNVTNYNVYYGEATNSYTNKLAIGLNLIFTLQTPYKDCHAVVTAVDNLGQESAPSNPAGINRRGFSDKVIAQTSTDLATWTNEFLVTEITNLLQQQFYRLRIQRTNNTTVYP